GRHRKEAPEDHDRDLDVELWAYSFFYPFGETRKHIGDYQARDQREDVSAFIGQLERPADAEFLQFSRRDRSEICEIANDPARIGDPEHCSESERELPDIALERDRGGTQDDEKRNIGCDQRAEAAKRCIRL